MRYTLIILVVSIIVLLTTNSFAIENYGLKGYIGRDIENWITHPVIINSIKKQNIDYRDVKFSQIAELDKTWKEDLKAGKGLANKELQSELAQYLKYIHKQKNISYAQIKVLDHKGFTVAESSQDQKYWAGKNGWRAAILGGTYAKHKGNIIFDDRIEKHVTEVSIAISDPKTRDTIGTVSILLNLDF